MILKCLNENCQESIEVELDQDNFIIVDCPKCDTVMQFNVAGEILK